jgi:hypothetical protein
MRVTLSRKRYLRRAGPSGPAAEDDLKVVPYGNLEVRSVTPPGRVEIMITNSRFQIPNS